MLVPVKWLNDYTTVPCDVTTYMDAMTMSGSKVEAVTYLGEGINQIVIGQIDKIEKHPDAEKLVVCSINVGKGENLQIVTGAKNVNEGDKVPVALEGALLPGDVKIKKSKLRGVESFGMLCSVEELGYTRNEFPEAAEDGIFILGNDAPIGGDIKPYLGLDDHVVEFEITNNRPDCFSIIGMARETAATFNQKFTYPDITVKAEAESCLGKVGVTIEDPKLCQRYSARIIKNIKIEESPKWMREKLVACGIRPINNVVDITNYVLCEFGQPMHAFDFDKLNDTQIIVRSAKEGEEIVTLDGITRKLTKDALVIADSNSPIAIAGVMGGDSTKIDETTKTILFESATFDGTSIRHTSKRINLRSDASGKFEKYLDPENTIDAVNRACQLIEMLGAGQVCQDIIDTYPIPRVEKVLTYNPEKINHLLGTQVNENEMVDIFNRLGFKVNEQTKELIIPTYRPDVETGADLAEEVARFYGYDNIPTTLASGTPTVGKKTKKQLVEDMVKEVVKAHGVYEALTYSFESPKVFDLLTIPQDCYLRQNVKIMNPLGEDFSIMRTTTAHSILNALATNVAKNNPVAALYELAYVYLPKEYPVINQPDEKHRLTVGFYGEGDFFSLKGIIENIANSCGLSEEIQYETLCDGYYYHPGRSAKLTYKGMDLGKMGQIHPQVEKNYDLSGATYLAEINMDVLVENATFDRKHKTLPKYPSVSRDLALIADTSVTSGEIVKVIKEFGGKLLVNLELFDVYQGKQIGEGKKSMAYALQFRADDRTLNESEISKVIERVLLKLNETLKVTLR